MLPLQHVFVAHRLDCGFCCAIGLVMVKAAGIVQYPLLFARLLELMGGERGPSLEAILVGTPLSVTQSFSRRMTVFCAYGAMLGHRENFSVSSRNVLRTE